MSLLAFLTLSGTESSLVTNTNQNKCFLSFPPTFLAVSVSFASGKYGHIIEMHLPLLVSDFSHKTQTFSYFYKINWIFTPVSLVPDLIPNSLSLIFLKKPPSLAVLPFFLFLRCLCSQDPILKTALWRWIEGVLCCESLREKTPFNLIPNIKSRILNTSS